MLLNPSTARARKRSQILAPRVAGLNRCQLHWRATNRALWTLVLCIKHALILPFGFRQATLCRALLRWRLQLSAKPCVRSEGLHRVDQQVGHSLMDVIARRAFERPDVEANRAGGNPRQHGSCLAHGAKWSQDGHDAIAFGLGGSATELSVTGRYRGGR